jgi:hypothetical protein
MDAMVHLTKGAVAYGQAVWSCPLDAGVKLLEMRDFGLAAETPRSISDGD